MSTVQDELDRILAAHGKLTAKIVVREATPTDHPLHDRFEWDDRIAGDKYRQEQARELIRSVTVRREPGLPKVRAYHSVARVDTTSYEPVEVLVEDDLARRIVLRQAEREWRAFRRRYRALTEFFVEILHELEAEHGEGRSA